MKQRVADLPACKKCGGRYVPLILCDTCGGAAVLRDLKEAEDRLPCPDCSTVNVTQMLCGRCHDRRPFASFSGPVPSKVRRPSVCPSCATFLGPKDAKCPTCGHEFEGSSAKSQRVKARRTRRIRGDLDKIQLQELQRIPGVTPERAESLARAGYLALWKLRRASEADLAKVAEIGADGAREILEALRSLPESMRRSSRDAAHPDEEFECPLCGCITSGFSLSCRDCRASFEEEEMDEAARANLIRDGDQGLLAFYDLRLMDEAEDEDLWFARGVLLDSLQRPKDALESFDKAIALNPSKRKISIARSRVLARVTNEPTASAQLRSTLRQVVETAALEQELAEFQQSVDVEGPTCAACGGPLAEGATRCPKCGAEYAPKTEELDELDIPEASTVTEGTQVLESLLEELEQKPEPKQPEPIPTSEPVAATASEEPVAPAEPAPVAETRLTEAEGGSPEAPHVSTPRGFRTRSIFHRLRRERPTGKVNGVINGQGLVNGKGLVNGRGRVNGFINGKGRVNGLVNGLGRTNGLVNGRGYVNGAGLAARRLPSRSRRTTLGFLIAGIAMAAIIGGALYLPAPSTSGPITIDGVFDDWSGVPALDLATSASNPDVEIARYASVVDRDDLYLRASTRGVTFGDSVGYDGIYFLVDSDGDSATGLVIDGLGADHVLETYGGNGTLVGARGYWFPSSTELNWSRRQGGAPVFAAASTQGVELRVSTFDLEPFDLNAFRVGVLADDYDGGRSRSEAFLSRLPGAIHVQVVPLTSVVGSGSTDLLEVRVRGLGITSDADRWTVSSFALNATPGVLTSLSAESVNLTRGQPSASLRVTVQAPGFLPGEAVEVDVVGATGPRPTSVTGGPTRAYVLAPNTTKRVDGLFDDWAANSVVDTDPSPVANADNDMIRFGAATDGVRAFFFVEVGGRLLSGSVPQRVVPIPAATGGGTSSNGTPEPRRTGEDILLAFVDVNATDGLGTFFEGILADYLVEIRGLGGRISSRTLYSWSSGWQRVGGNPVASAKNESAIEVSVAMPVTADVRMAFAATDWTDIGDRTSAIQASVGAPASPITGPTPLFAPGLIIHSGTNAQTVLARSLSAEPTVDGSCGTSGTEYAGGDTASNANLKFFVGRRSDISYVFVCLELTADTSDGGTSDWGELLFDQDHDESSTPQDNDRRFRVTGGDGSSVFTQEKGTGSGWTACGGSCDSGNAAKGKFNNSVNEVYEFKIRFADIWGSDSPSTGERAGFAIYALNNAGPTTYTWGADNVDEGNPSTWGHLDIPEFQDLIVPAGAMLVIGLLRRRRRQNT